MQNSLENLTPHDIEIMAGVKLHEFSHALSGDEFTAVADRHGVNSLEFYMAKRLGESRADGFRADALVRNGADIAHLYQLAAAYDRGTRIDEAATDRNTSKANQVWAYSGRPDSYDPGNELLEIAHRYYQNRNQTVPRHYPASYHLSGLRDSYSRVFAIFNESPDNDLSFAYYLRSDAHAAHEAILAMQNNGDKDAAIRTWMHNRPEIFYGVPQTLSAQAYLADENATRYNAVAAQVTSLEEATGRAMQKVQQTLSTLREDKLTGAFLEKIAHPNSHVPAETEALIFDRLGLNGPMISMRPESYVDLISTTPALRDRLDMLQKSGTTITFAHIMQAMQGLPIDPATMPQATSEERWSVLTTISKSGAFAFGSGATQLWSYVMKLSDDASLSSPEMTTAWSLWQQLVSPENPKLNGKGFSAVEAAQAFTRIPPATVNQLVAGTNIQELVPAIQALAAITPFSYESHSLTPASSPTTRELVR